MIRSCTSLLKQIYLYITNIYNLLIHNNDSIFIINPRPSSLVYMYIQIHFLSLTFFFLRRHMISKKKKILRIPSGRFLDIYSWGFSIFKIRCRLIQEGTFLARTPLGKNRNTFSFPFRHFTHGNFQSNCFSIFYSTPSASSIRGGGNCFFLAPNLFGGVTLFFIGLRGYLAPPCLWC